MANTGRLINIVGKKMQAKLTAALTDHPLAVGQIPFLRQLYIEDGLNQQELSVRVNLEASTTVRTLDRMERDGLIKRRRGDNDRRVINIYLTSKAKALKNIISNATNKTNHLATKYLSKKQIQTLHEILQLMDDNLSQDIK